MTTIQLRTATAIPSDADAPTGNKHVIIFKHPAYPEEYDQNVLLRLYAWDHPNGGLHGLTGHLACALIACNAWDGYLTVDRDGEKLEIQDDRVLTAQEYYFHVPEPSSASSSTECGHSFYKYPVCPSFQHWTFPHRHVPSQWCEHESDESTLPSHEPSSTPPVSSVSAAVIARDRACALSKARDYIERAHLCPRSELEWFRTNGMRRYNARLDISGDFITDDTANAVALRADIRRAFDDCKFVFVRKAGRWVPHFLETTYELGRKFHNLPMEVTAGVAPEFILARFAWAIFPLVKAFMEQGPMRVVKVREQSEGEHREVVKTLSPSDFAQLAGAARGRSTSPKKRKASESLPPIAETKRRCVLDEPMVPHALCRAADPCSHKSAVDTPCLPTDDGALQQRPSTAISSTSSPPGTSSEEDRLSNLRMRELRKRRPQNLDILCCDYDLAEHANALGIPGKPEYGGAHLCPVCLGCETELVVDERDEWNVRNESSWDYG